MASSVDYSPSKKSNNEEDVASDSSQLDKGPGEVERARDKDANTAKEEQNRPGEENDDSRLK